MPDEGYFNYLKGIAGLRLNYSRLARVLFSIPFRGVLELDEDRVYDGLKIRDEYCRETGLSLDSMNDIPCSVLECLIGLARRLDYLVEDETSGDMTRVWFWEMCINLGLSIYTDDFMDIWKDSTDDIIEILERWMHRKFEPDGTFSPFPLRHPKQDQRFETLNYQINHYAEELLESQN